MDNNLVLLLDSDEGRKVTDASLHGVDPLHHNHDLLPRPPGPGVAVDQGLAKLSLEIVCVVVLEDLKCGNVENV